MSKFVKNTLNFQKTNKTRIMEVLAAVNSSASPTKTKQESTSQDQVLTFFDQVFLSVPPMYRQTDKEYEDSDTVEAEEMTTGKKHSSKKQNGKKQKSSKKEKKRAQMTNQNGVG